MYDPRIDQDGLVLRRQDKLQHESNQPHLLTYSPQQPLHRCQLPATLSLPYLSTLLSHLATLLSQPDFNLVSSYLDACLTDNRDPLSIPCTLTLPLGLGLSGCVQLTPSSSPGCLDFDMPSGYTDLDHREEDFLIGQSDEDLLSEESMPSLPQVPQSHRYSTLSNIRSSPGGIAPLGRRVLTVVEGLMVRLASVGHRGQRGRDADV